MQGGGCLIQKERKKKVLRSGEGVPSLQTTFIILVEF